MPATGPNGPVTYVTASEALITVSIQSGQAPGGGTPQFFSWPANLKSWATFQGGDSVSSTTLLYPGGMVGGIAMPGPRSRSDVTVTTPFTADLQVQVPFIDMMVNHAMTAGFTLVDGDGNPTGTYTVTRHGILKEAHYPSFDAKSGEPVFLELIMACNF